MRFQSGISAVSVRYQCGISAVSLRYPCGISVVSVRYPCGISVVSVWCTYVWVRSAELVMTHPAASLQTVVTVTTSSSICILK